MTTRTTEFDKKTAVEGAFLLLMENVIVGWKGRRKHRRDKCKPEHGMEVVLNLGSHLGSAYLLPVLVGDVMGNWESRNQHCQGPLVVHPLSC
jgi:hypothetical protein